MENNTPQEIPAAQSNTASQVPPQPIVVKKRFPFKYILLGFGSVVLIAASVSATYMFMQSKETGTNTPQPQKNETVSPSQPSPTSVPTTINMETFTDPNIEGMTFIYDPDVWELTKINKNNIDLVPEGFNKVFGDTGVLMKEKKSDGMLYMKYGYEVGRGGAMGAIYKGHYKQLGSISRVKSEDKNYYVYGMDNQQTRTLFAETPDKITNYEGLCAPDYDGYGGLSEEMCADMESGEIMGFYADPTYTWSLKLKRIGDIRDIWNDVEYLGNLQPSSVQIETQYLGNNPELADEIVTQLFK